MRQHENRLNLTDLSGLDDLPTFDPADHLDSEEAIAAYMTDIIATGDIALLRSAIDDVVRARGVAKVAESAGITREGLYKALRANSKPRFETVAAVLDALGLAVHIVPKRPVDDSITEASAV